MNLNEEGVEGFCSIGVEGIEGIWCKIWLEGSDKFKVVVLGLGEFEDIKIGE